MPGPGWCVVLETREPTGAPYTNLYRHVQAGLAEEAIDYALARFVGINAGERALIPGWYVVNALAVAEDNVSEWPIEPVIEPAFKRGERRDW